MTISVMPSALFSDSSTSVPFLLSMDDFASCFNEKIGAIRRELPWGLTSISFPPTCSSVHILCLVFCKCTNDLGSYPKATLPFVHLLDGSNGPSPLAYSRGVSRDAYIYFAILPILTSSFLPCVVTHSYLQYRCLFISPTLEHSLLLLPPPPIIHSSLPFSAGTLELFVSGIP